MSAGGPSPLSSRFPPWLRRVGTPTPPARPDSAGGTAPSGRSTRQMVVRRPRRNAGSGPLIRGHGRLAGVITRSGERRRLHVGDTERRPGLAQLVELFGGPV